MTVTFVCRIDQDMHGKVEIAAAAVPEWPCSHCKLWRRATKNIFEPQPLLCLYSGQRGWILGSLQVPFLFLNCCLLHGGSLIRVFPHAVWNVFNLFIYCWYIMSILAYWCSLVIVVCTRYWRHSVTIGCCMFCFITFKYVFIFKRWQWREINIFLWWLWFLNCILVFWPIEWRFIEQVLMAPFFSLFTADVLC